MRRRPSLRTLTAFPVSGAAFPVAATASDTILALEGPVPGRPDFWLEAPGMAPLANVMPWTHEVQPVSSATLVRRLRTSDASTQLRAEALNRYGMGLLPGDAGGNSARLANRRDDAPIRNGGPLSPVFPWPTRPGLAEPLVDQCSIWQPRCFGVG
jgi:hypothetical protein